MTERVVVAMSGGVDSSVAAALLLEQGYEVIGVMMRLWSEPVAPTLGGTVEAATNRCCTVESVHDARGVAERLGIPFYVINVEETFKTQVVDLFIAGYTAGQTPNPCLACNRHIRFGHLLRYARALGAAYLATGHYAQVGLDTAGRYQLRRGADRAKDQSYVLGVLDAGQCNDSYSLAVIALKLKEAFGLSDINELPVSYDIAWYEQKAVAVLLALLYLGVKGMRLGPTLPGFLSPNVAKVLVEKFDLKPIGTVEEDIAAMMAGK